MITKLKSFVVDRLTWLRGEGYRQSNLLRIDGKKCCLGFACNAMGFIDEQIRNIFSPMSVCSRNSIEDALLFSGLLNGDGDNSAKCHEIMITNDDEHITDVERESILTNKFGELGIKVTFIN